MRNPEFRIQNPGAGSGQKSEVGSRCGMQNPGAGGDVGRTSNIEHLNFERPSSGRPLRARLRRDRMAREGGVGTLNRDGGGWKGLWHLAWKRARLAHFLCAFCAFLRLSPRLVPRWLHRGCRSRHYARGQRFAARAPELGVRLRFRHPLPARSRPAARTVQSPFRPPAWCHSRHTRPRRPPRPRGSSARRSGR